MWSSKDTVTDMEEILNDTISAQELEVSWISQFELCCETSDDSDSCSFNLSRNSRKFTWRNYRTRSACRPRRSLNTHGAWSGRNTARTSTAESKSSRISLKTIPRTNVITFTIWRLRIAASKTTRRHRSTSKRSSRSSQIISKFCY